MRDQVQEEVPRNEVATRPAALLTGTHSADQPEYVWNRQTLEFGQFHQFDSQNTFTFLFHTFGQSADLRIQRFSAKDP